MRSNCQSVVVRRLIRDVRFLLVVIALAVASGCDEASGGPQPLVRDSAGITIVDHGNVDRASLPEWSLASTPLVRIGTIAGGPEYQFHRVEDAIQLDDGSIAVIDNSRTLRLYDAVGGHLWTAGGQGDGPGEFRYPFMVRQIAGDSLIVWDGAVNRLNIFTRDGRFSRDATASGVARPTVARGLSGPRTVLVEGRRVEPTRIDGHAALLHPADFHLVDLEGNVVRNLGRKLFATNFQEVDENGAYSGAIFASSAVIAPAADGLWFGTTTEYELQEVSSPDQIRRIVRWRGPDRTVTDADVEGILAEWGRDATPEVRQFLLAYGKTHPRADRFPAYEELRVDRNGRLWVRDYVKEHQDDGRRRWLILSPDGTRIMAQLIHDASLELHDLGTDFVLAVEQDDMGVEFLVVRRVIRDGGGATNR